MEHFFYILANVIFPIFLQVAFGFVLQKLIKLDPAPLAKIQMYILIPALLFTKMYEADVDGGVFLAAALHSTLLFLALLGLSALAAKLGKLPKARAAAFVNSVSMYNSGNFCIPLVELLYHSPFALAVQFIVMTMQSIFTNTFGIFIASSGGGEADSHRVKRALISVLKVPMIYALALGIAFRAFGVTVPQPIMDAVTPVGNALVPVALITLGIQLADVKIDLRDIAAWCSVALRLLVSPVIAFALVLLLGITGVTANVLIIASAAPTAVNAVLLSILYKSDPDFSSKTVFLSTVISPITVALLISLLPA